MKRVYTVLGLALLMGCANSGNNSDCPRKDKSCGKGITQNLTSAEVVAVEHKEAAQEAATVVENVTPSN